MSRPLDISEFIKLSQGHLTIDVRSPKEFLKGHIPHAVNMPLFDDEERAIVGTLYKQAGRNEAIEKGLEIVGPKMADFVRFVKPLAKDNKIFIHCWRGGMRSGSVAWLMDTMGYEVCTLRQGYKAYRHLVLNDMDRQGRYIILGGRTGSGKTCILQKLREKGEQILDLERLANHKGSAFGSLGEPPQPTTEQFENDMHLEFSKLDFAKPIWLEDESKNIGRCYITNELWGHMCQSPAMVIDIPLQERIRYLVDTYGEQPTAGLEDSVRKLERRLGNESMKQALKALAEGDLQEVVRITLRYYDKAYDHGIHVRPAHLTTHISYEGKDHEYIAADLIGRSQNTLFQSFDQLG